ncbi:phosphopentomutase [Desulfopila sp. IMCC35008]|uniref:phosphopentomutase n=1 Tax=Desulfopila sp. IMCC35008 TaxID=2653858 RepID=UPI0013CFC0DE|nr:phosphopentomutase [Desulfopila sp. IMCC35008]
MRALLIIIDSFGIGALPDAHLYGDEGANTALHICEGVELVGWPTLRKMGLGNCAELAGHVLPGCEPVAAPLAAYGAMVEVSQGKDTTTGHWELAGVVLTEPFQTFPLPHPSFPEELLDHFRDRTGYEVLGNKGASGTAIIEELGELHMKGKGLIVYTSADSVLQVAAHEQVVSLEELYRVCEITRELADPYRIGRVIARPFIGEPGRFKRTSARKDFSMVPPHDTILDVLQKNDVETIAIGKIGDIFCERGIDVSYHDSGNVACLERLVSCLESSPEKDQFIFVNLVDTDMHFGHRRDIKGYHDAVAKIDRVLDRIITLMSGDDMLIITADHGCDPGFKGSDHTREYVPLLVHSGGMPSENLGVRGSFSDVGQSLASFFAVPGMSYGTSFV